MISRSAACVGATILANVATYAVLMFGVLRVAAQTSYDPWWPSSWPFYLITATQATLLTAVLAALLRRRLLPVLDCPPPTSDSPRPVSIDVEYRHLSGEIDCTYADPSRTQPSETTTFPALLALRGRL